MLRSQMRPTMNGCAPYECARMGALRVAVGIGIMHPTCRGGLSGTPSAQPRRPLPPLPLLFSC